MRFWRDLFLAAVLFCTFTGVWLHKVATAYLDGLRADEDFVTVMVAHRDLHEGVVVGEGDLYALQIPTRYLPEGVFLSPEHVVGRVPRERILANELVRAERLAEPEVVVPRGMRAISVEYSDWAAILTFVVPSSSVDVLFVDSQRQAHTIVQEATVLAIQEDVVTLLVTARQAEMLAHAEHMGELVLTLRNVLDVTCGGVPRE